MHSTKRFKKDHEGSVLDMIKMDIEDPDPMTEPEPRIFSEAVTLSFINIDHELPQIITDLTDFEALEINDIPTINDAVNLISSDLLRQKFYQTSYSIAIKLKIFGQITTLSPLQYEIISTKIDKTRKLLLCFESLDDKRCCFYWKSDEEMPLMSLSLIDVDIVDRDSMNGFINSFLFLALRLGNKGIPQDANMTSSTDLSLFSLVDMNDKNLLMLASELGNRSVVEDLIKIGFDVNFQVENQIAADLAWENRHLDVLLSLLLENSLYPVDFNEANTSNEVKDFVKMTHQFVKSVKNNDEVIVQNILEKYPNLRYFYSRDNVSAAFVALSKEKFNIYKIFMNKNVCVGPKEDIDKILTKLNDKQREELRKIHLEHSREPPEKFLMILHSNTSVGHDTINVNEKLNHAKSAIEYLCRISVIRLILQIVAASRDFKLIFDFNRDSVQFLDPTSSKQTRGSFFTSRQVYIAAKFLLDPEHRQEAIGTLAHELCHFAMFLVYRNNCLPYFNGDHKMAKTYHGYLKYCHENRKKEPIMGYVFDIPKENQETRHAELIVRVPHLLALYHENTDKLDQIREYFLPLFSFFEFKVVEDMKIALPNIETEADGEIKKFNDKRKRKGFCSMRNLIILIIVACISVIGIALGIYFGVSRNSNNDLVGEVFQPWNAIVRHSRTDEIMCIGSIIHPEFVLTTAECVQKKHHRNPLPPGLFIADFHRQVGSLRLEVAEINVFFDWKFNEDNLGSDLSLLRLKDSLKFTVHLRSVNLPLQILQLNKTALHQNTRSDTVLHTVMGLHSFNIPITKIDTIECIIDEYTINKYLGDLQYCARQIVNKYCINGYGEQVYDSVKDTLHGLVSMGHMTEANCASNNSLIITELGYYSDSIRNAVCGDRYYSSNDYNMWTTESEINNFMVAVMDNYTSEFLCWAFFVSHQVLLTDSNCLRLTSENNIRLKSDYNNWLNIQTIENSDVENITKITLTANSSSDITIDIVNNEQNLLDLENVKIVYNYELYGDVHASRFYHYRNKINERVLSDFCVQYSGGPVFMDINFTAKLYGIVIKKPCEDDCTIEDNGYKVGYVNLFDHKNWILGALNPISGEVFDREYCTNGTECRILKVFSATSFKIVNNIAPIYVDHQYSKEVEVFESITLKNIEMPLPINVDDVFPNLVKYTFQNIAVKEISLDNFWKLSALEFIDLSNNQIVSIDSDTFNHTTKLKELKLENNQISFFNEDILQPLKNLEIFDINSNLLKSNLSIFKYCSNIKQIILSKNEITEIRNNIFVNCGLLETVDFNSNEISFLNTDIFLNKPNLKHVDLRWNTCISKEFVGSNGTKFTTDAFNSMMNEISVCYLPQTTTFMPMTVT